MADVTATRRLAAIVSADVVGYSRLMGDDEEGTLATLNSHRREVIDPTIERHGGRIVKTTGDGLLLEFASVVDAVRCCLSMQELMRARNQATPGDKQIRYRMGVNLGDVIIEDGDLFGDGVNIAARLEGIAAPGGICISSAVFEQVRQKLDLEVEDLGDRALKNIETPVRTYRVIQGGGSDTPDQGAGASESGGERVSLPQRPVIAVLPFRNLSSDGENDFIADGIGLGIQTLMVQLPGLYLINANSDQSYRAGTKSAAEVVDQLPVRYVLEGTAQRAGHRIRVTVRMTDLQGDAVVWAERYDRDLDDVFALQDEITREVISSLNIELFGRDYERIVMRDLDGDGAWEYFLRGVSHIYMFTDTDNKLARGLFEKLYALRPEKVHGPSYVALTHWIDLTRGWTTSPEESLAEAAKWATIATKYKENDGIGFVVMSYVKLHENRHDEALALCEQAVGYRANCPAALGQIATVRLYSGDARGAVKSAREALGVRTMHPPLVVNLLANAYRDSGEIDLSIPAAKEALRLEPSQTGALATLCSNYMLAGDEANAKRVAREIVNINPAFRISQFSAVHPYKDRATQTHLAEILRAAGLPD